MHLEGAFGVCVRSVRSGGRAFGSCVRDGVHLQVYIRSVNSEGAFGGCVPERAHSEGAFE